MKPPPFTITPRILGQVAHCCELVGSWRGGSGMTMSPQLRRENRIRSIHASLAIENHLQFMLDAIAESLTTKGHTDQVSDQVKFLLASFRGDLELPAEALLQRLGLRHRPTFRKNYLAPAIAAGLLEMTEPDSPPAAPPSATGSRSTRHLDMSTLHIYCAAHP